MNVMDYSLLVGIHYIDKTNNKNSPQPISLVWKDNDNHIDTSNITIQAPLEYVSIFSNFSENFLE